MTGQLSGLFPGRKEGVLRLGLIMRDSMIFGILALGYSMKNGSGNSVVNAGLKKDFLCCKYIFR